jgi:hypothetical protein
MENNTLFPGKRERERREQTRTASAGLFQKNKKVFPFRCAAHVCGETGDGWRRATGSSGRPRVDQRNKTQKISFCSRKNTPVVECIHPHDREHYCQDTTSRRKTRTDSVSCPHRGRNKKEKQERESARAAPRAEAATPFPPPFFFGETRRSSGTAASTPPKKKKKPGGLASFKTKTKVRQTNPLDSLGPASAQKTPGKQRCPARHKRNQEPTDHQRASPI